MAGAASKYKAGTCKRSEGDWDIRHREHTGTTLQCNGLKCAVSIRFLCWRRYLYRLALSLLVNTEMSQGLWQSSVNAKTILFCGVSLRPVLILLKNDYMKKIQHSLWVTIPFIVKLNYSVFTSWCSITKPVSCFIILPPDGTSSPHCA